MRAGLFAEYGTPQSQEADGRGRAIIWAATGSTESVAACRGTSHRLYPRTQQRWTAIICVQDSNFSSARTEWDFITPTHGYPSITHFRSSRFLVPFAVEEIQKVDGDLQAHETHNTGRETVIGNRWRGILFGASFGIITLCPNTRNSGALPQHETCGSDGSTYVLHTRVAPPSSCFKNPP